MEKIKYVVHSDVNENNIYAEFDNMDEAIEYANDNIDSETWVDMVTCDENGEECDYITVWNYQDDGDPFSANFPIVDVVDNSDDPDYEEFAKQYEDITENCDIDFDEMQEAMEENEDEVECKICFERHPKPDCIKTPAGYVCKECMEEALGKEQPVVEEEKVEEPEPVVEDKKEEPVVEEKVEEVKEKITEAAEKELEIPEDFEGQMDFLAADEDEAIEGYEAVLKVIEDEHIKGELEKIRTEEIAHKDFLEKIKTDPTAVYTEPLMDEEPEEETEEEEAEADLEESKKDYASKKDLKENLEDEIKDYLAYCKKEKLEAKDYKSLQKYMDAKNANLTEGDFVDDANADILDSQADKYEEEENLRKEIKENTDLEESAKDIIELDQDVKIGDVIRIIHLDGEDNKYDDKQGIIKSIDDLGQLHGTWGGVAVIPGVDEFEKVEMQTTIREATEETPVRSDPSIDSIIAS